MPRALILLIVLYSFVAMSFAETHQISNGVRVMMSAGYYYDEQRATNPDTQSFMVLSQPIIESVIPNESGKALRVPADVLQFFAALPAHAKVGGLWITRLSNGSPRNKSDNDRIASLVDGASKFDFPIFVCDARQAKRNVHTWLVAWECNMEFPKRESPFICEPSDEAKQPGPPLWSCTEIPSPAAPPVALSAEGASAGDGPRFRGAYIANTTLYKSMTLHCISDTNCTLEVTVDYKGRPISSEDKHSDARRLEDLGQVRSSYTYAKEHSNQNPANARDAEMLRQLEPLFSKNPEITACIDLDPKQPQLAVVCKLDSSPWNLPAILYFQKLKTCGPSL
jgi:hypothetical protein